MRHGRFSLLFLLSLIFLMGCEDPDQCIVNDSDDRVLRKTFGPFAVSNLKVRISDRSDGRIENDPNEEIDKGTNLNVLVDETCSSLEKGSISGSLSFRRSVEGVRKSPFETYVYEVPEDTTFGELEAEAQQDSCVVGISNRVKIKMANEYYFNDPNISWLWHLKDVRATKGEGWNSVYDHLPVQLEDVVLAVIDTGISTEHEEFVDILWTNEAELNGVEGVDDDGNGYVDDIHGYNFMAEVGDPKHTAKFQSWDHGTHVAGLAAAQGNNEKGISGVAGKGVRVMALNVFGKKSYTYSEYIDRAIRYAADNGAHVINISLGGTGRSDTTSEAVAYAINKGVTVVVAAGNSNANIDDRFYTPASYARDHEGMLAVAATFSRSNKFCPFTNYGTDTVNIGAPGCDIGSMGRPWNGISSTRNWNSYGKMAGTSMASPIVAGAALLVNSHRLNSLGYSEYPSEVERLITTFSRRESRVQRRIKNGANLDIRILGHELSQLGTPEPCMAKN